NWRRGLAASSAVSRRPLSSRRCAFPRGGLRAESVGYDPGEGGVELLQPVEIAGVLGDRPGAVGDADELQRDVLDRHPGDEFAARLGVLDGADDAGIKLLAEALQGGAAGGGQRVAVLAHAGDQAPGAASGPRRVVLRVALAAVIDHRLDLA